MSSLHPANPIQHALARLVEDLTGSVLEPDDSARERLFVLLVEGLDLYVMSLLADEPHVDGVTSLGQAMVDRDVLDNPELLANYDEHRRVTWVRLTAEAMADNLDPH
jgi:hypothetical protein